MFADYPRAHLPRSSLLPVDWPVSAQSEARTMYDLLGDREHGRDFDLHTEKVLMKGGGNSFSGTISRIEAVHRDMVQAFEPEPHRYRSKAGTGI